MIYSSKAREGEKDLAALLETKPFKVKLNKVLPDASWYRVFFYGTLEINGKGGTVLHPSFPYKDLNP